MTTTGPRRLTLALGIAASLLLLNACADDAIRMQADLGTGCAHSAPCPDGQRCVESRCVAAEPEAEPDAGPLDRSLPPIADAAMRSPEIGDPCDGPDDCPSGYCIEAAGDGRRICTDFCNPADDRCPEGLVCAAVSNAGPDRTFLCFPEVDPICTPCADDADCGRASDRCLTYVDGRFCGRTCAERACPEGFECVDDPDGDGPPQCRGPDAVCSGCFDPDDDGYGVGPDCAGPDCAPEDGDRFPGAEELCNAADDDCDEATDEGFDLQSDPDRCGACDEECSFEGAEALCVDAECALGPCRPDRYDLDRRVDNGCEYFCEGAPGADELCDGDDQDCDGEVDEGDPGGGADCSTGEPGRCDAGATRCAGGALVCERAFDPLPETCEGTDEDCDGQTDEGAPGAGGDCDTGRPGRCAAGVEVCRDGALQCDERDGSRAEICDGVDDDCDGAVDNGCPASISTGADRAGPQYGGGGGSLSRLVCGAGRMAVGIDVRSAAEVDRVEVICQQIGLRTDAGANPNRFFTTARGGQSRTGAAGGGGGDARSFVCPDGTFLHRMRVRSGARVDQITVGCAGMELTGYPGGGGVRRTDGQGATFGGAGGGQNPEFRCGDGEFIAGFNVRAGARVDRIGPICRAWSVRTR